MPIHSVIPLHSLSNRTAMGLEVHRIDGDVPVEAARFGVHRDDHYILIFQESGSNRMMIDFQEVRFEGCIVYCILPGQVHQADSVFDGAGWFIATDLHILEETYRAVLEDFVTDPVPILVGKQTAENLRKTIALLHDLLHSREKEPFQQAMLHSMVQVCAGAFAGIFELHKHQHQARHSRPVMISNTFRKMVVKEFRTVKSPAAYAEALNISASYLNEAVKDTTGFPVSYWIQREVVMEAKRLLYYTDLHIKEIAFQIGYPDHTYFSRLFQKVTGIYPAAFRKQYRK